MRAEKLLDPEVYIPALLDRVQKKHIQRIYHVNDWTDEEDFLKQVATYKGKLLKGGEPDFISAAKIILTDWQRGEIPYYAYPPDYVIKKNEKGEIEDEEEEEHLKEGMEQEEEIIEDEDEELL